MWLSGTGQDATQTNTLNETRLFVQRAIRNGSPDEQIQAWTDLGRCYLNQPDYHRAILCFAKAEALLGSTSDNRQKGILFLNIAETYRQTSDYLRAVEYANHSRDAFSETTDTVKFYLSQAVLGEIYQHLNQWNNADSLFNLALPHFIRDTTAARKYLSLQAKGKMLCGEKDVDSWGALNLLFQKIDVFRGVWTPIDQAVAAYAFAMLHLDQTCDTLLEALNRHPHESREQSLFLQYRIARFRDRPQEALLLADEFFAEKEQPKSQVLSSSLSHTLQNYYEEELLDAKNQARLARAETIAFISFLLVGVVVSLFFVERRRRRLLNEKDRLLRLAEETKHFLEDAEKSQADLRHRYAKMYQRQYEAIGSLCESYFDQNNNTREIRKDRVFMKVEALLAYISENETLHKRFEEQVDAEMDGLLTKMKKDLGGLSLIDSRTVCYHMIGFPTSTISTILGTSPNAVYTRLSRIRNRVEKATTPNKQKYLQILS